MINRRAFPRSVMRVEMLFLVKEHSCIRCLSWWWVLPAVNDLPQALVVMRGHSHAHHTLSYFRQLLRSLELHVLVSCWVTSCRISSLESMHTVVSSRDARCACAFDESVNITKNCTFSYCNESSLLLFQFPSSLERFTTSVLESLPTDASMTAEFFS